MNPKRGARVAPPAGVDEWEVRFGNTTAAKGWESLCQQAPGNTRAAWQQMRTNPASPPTPRHHQLEGTLAFADHAGKRLACWQIEVTGGGRIWYLLDPDRRTVWITYAGTGHPKKTD